MNQQLRQIQIIFERIGLNGLTSDFKTTTMNEVISLISFEPFFDNSRIETIKIIISTSTNRFLFSDYLVSMLRILI